jgi:hypothetical protein
VKCRCWTNNLFAIAKRWWRTEREKYCGPDFSKQALYLLYYIAYIKLKQVKTVSRVAEATPLLTQNSDSFISSTRLIREKAATFKSPLSSFRRFHLSGFAFSARLLSLRSC